MNFFEQEFRKLTENKMVFSNAKFIGRECYIPITNSTSTRLKLEFVTQGTVETYLAIKATMINKKDGVIDTLILTFADIWGKKRMSNPKFDNEIIPKVWTSGEKTEWYAYKPTSADYEVLSQQLESYAELFMDQEQTQNRGMSQQI